MIKAANTLLKSIYFSIPYSIRLGTTYYKTKSFLYKEQWSNPDKVYEWQFNRYQSMLTYAYKYCPGYFFLYKDAGFHPNDFSSLSDIPQIPCVSKELLSSNIEDFRSKDPKLRNIKYIATSGSSGNPLRFYKNDPYDTERDIAFIHYGWEQIGWRLGDRKAVFMGSFVGKKDKVFHTITSDNSILMSTYFLDNSTYSQYLDVLKSNSIRYLHGYPSSLTALAGYLISNERCSELNISSVFLASEMNLQSQISLLETAFPHAKIHSHYGNTEQTVLAHWDIDRHYQFNPYYGYVYFKEEINGFNIISTSFGRKATPFINYITDDLCGNLYCPVNYNLEKAYIKTDKLLGRSNECLITRDGRRIPSAAINFHDRSLDSLLHYRFVQHDYSEVTLELVLRDSTQSSTNLSSNIVKCLTRNLPDDFNIKVVFKKDIPSLPSGKRSLIVSMLSH